MTEWLLALVVWLTPTSDADALRVTAPSYLDTESARVHLAAARIAAQAYRLDPDVLLAIAWRESRYNVDAATHEASGKWSCGVMMVTMPLGRRCPSTSILDSYLGGAAHLREWRQITRTERDALLGYAGGHPMIAACANGGELVRMRAGREVDLCRTPELGRAAWIRSMRTKLRDRTWPPARRAYSRS